MMPCWYDGPLAAFDTETTGIDVERDRIVSAALVVQETPRSAPRVTRWLINPGVEIPEAATAVHGLTADHSRCTAAGPRRCWRRSRAPWPPSRWPAGRWS